MSFDSNTVFHGFTNQGYSPPILIPYSQMFNSFQQSPICQQHSSLIPMHWKHTTKGAEPDIAPIIKTQTFPSEPSKFIEKIQNSDKKTKLAEPWASALRRIKSSKRTLGKTISKANLVTEEVEQEEASAMLDEGATDSDQARTRAVKNLGNLENNEKLEETDIGGEETRNGSIIRS